MNCLKPRLRVHRLKSWCISFGKDRAEAVDLINQVAPEHLELCLDDAEAMSQDIRHAGAILWVAIHLKQLVIIVLAQTTYYRHQAQLVSLRHLVYMIFKSALV